MGLEPDDQARVDEAIRSGANPGGTRLLVLNATETQRLKPVTVACTILNRTIGSGIYVTPAIVLKSTGSVGASLLLWAGGAVISISALLVWLELGLSIPKFELANRDENDTVLEGEDSLQCVPRNGGEKNYLEYIYKVSNPRTTCMYGLIYVVLGNLSGNAVAFGIYVLEASNVQGHDSLVRGLAVICLTSACALHAAWRKGGIFVNNALAMLKVTILLAIIVIGFAASAGVHFDHRPVHGETINPITQKATSNFDPHTSFAFARKDLASYADSLLFVVYTFSGYEQPFYVLNEVYQPKRYFAKTTIWTMSLVAILFMLVNVAYLCAVSDDQRLNNDLDMATVFFSEVFGTEVAPRVMSGIIAFSIFGNIVVMTFTASRVKQEIAKEGVLPFSLFFAGSTITPWAWFRQRFWPSKDPDEQPEQTPTAALLLHWIFCMILIAATSSTTPKVAYTTLVSLYSYTVVILVGFFVSAGLLWLQFFGERDWAATAGFNFCGPTAALIYAVTCLFLLCAAFVPPTTGSPFAKLATGIDWYIVPTVGLCTLLLGLVYYLGFQFVYPRLLKGKRVLVVEREAVIVREHGEYVQALEIVETSWQARSGPGSIDDAEVQAFSVIAR